eukprot:1190137-Prorocentrum_minimum.AAC.5
MSLRSKQSCVVKPSREIRNFDVTFTLLIGDFIIRSEINFLDVARPRSLRRLPRRCPASPGDRTSRAPGGVPKGVGGRRPHRQGIRRPAGFQVRSGSLGGDPPAGGPGKEAAQRQGTRTPYCAVQYCKFRIKNLPNP